MRYAAAVENLQSLIDAGVKFCWISSHASCSPRCAPFQGRLYSLFQGKATVGGIEYGERGTIDGIPYRPINEALAGVNGDGNGCISGYNCRHRAVEYRRGDHPPQDYTEAQLKREYAVDQRQRAYENQIRQIKTEERQLRAAGMEKDAALLRKKWRRLTMDYQIYSIEHDRAYYPYRCVIDSAELQSNAEENLTEGAESGIISIEDCKDFNGLSSYMTTVCGVAVDESVRDLDFPAVKQSLTGVDRVMREFPQAHGMLKEISIGKGGIMATYFNGKITFNPAYYQNGNPSVSPITAERSATGFHPHNMGVQGVGSHEMGHILEKALIEQSNPDDGSVISRIARAESWKKCTEAKNVISEACKAAKQTAEGKGLLNDQLRAQVSRYATADYSECMAECVADYMTNRESASLLSREVWKILKRRLN